MTDNDIRRMAEAYLSYKLTKSAFGSGELKTTEKILKFCTPEKLL